jgi:hypothetical protein
MGKNMLIRYKETKAAWDEYVALHGRDAAIEVDKAAGKAIREQHLDTEDALDELLRTIKEGNEKHTKRITDN